MTESSIWQSLQNGDMSALRMLYDHHVDTLYQYGMVLIQDQEKVQDSIHDLFLALWTGRQKLSVPQSTKAYLMVSLRRKIFDKGPRIQSLTGELGSSVEMVSTDLNPEIDWINREDERIKEHKLTSALKALSDRQREIIYMKYYQQMEYEEISRVMDLNYQSARNLLTRALTALRKEMLAIVIILLMLP